MKRYLFLYIAALLLSANAAAQQRCGLKLNSVSMQRNAASMTVALDMNLEDFDLKGNRVAVFTPVIAGEQDSLKLPPVGLYSRDRWYQYLRSGDGPASGPDETTIRWSQRPDEYSYTQTVPYADWMKNSHLVLLRKDYGCCRELVAQELAPLPAEYHEVHYTPKFYYSQPQAEAVKTRELSGRAFIDFPVNRTEIYTDYRNNRRELAKIIATIDSVRSDKDVTVKRITIKGFASPEGTYENNTRLAKGRTEALKQYVQTLYNFHSTFIATDYEPEDWEGLREFVLSSNLAHRSEILAIIDDPTLLPDTKDWRIKLRYPDDYRYLLTNVYPALRHSDYTIEYTIRSFSDPNEIAQLLHTAPQKLNLSEMLIYARTLEPGSDEYNDVFETAVRIFPDSEVANLNAANSAMQRNDLRNAERYLAKAGDSSEAIYARGVLAALRGDYDKALEYINASSVEGKAEIISHIEVVKKYM